MRIHSRTSALIVLWLCLQCSEGIYQPECNSFDEIVHTIDQSVEEMPTLPGLEDASINCTRNSDCDGFTCWLSVQRQTTEINMELKPCEEPPQMYILMRDVQTDHAFVEETVTHGESFPIPGLTYTYQFLVLSAALNVQFQKVSHGINFGLTITFNAGGYTMFELPILPPMVISVPDCTSPGSDTQCTRMQTLVDTLHPPHDFLCYKSPDCKGVNCSGGIPTPMGTTLYTTATIDIDSCADPVSYIIGVYHPDGFLLWTRTFTHSENVMLDVPLPRGITIDFNITMHPYLRDIDYMRTTIELTLCLALQCTIEKFIDNALVPIPPCDQVMTSTSSRPSGTTTPLAGELDECLTMQAIAHDIQNNGEFVPESMICHANGPCDGVECTIQNNGNQFDVNIKLYHCEDPVRLHVVITGLGNDYHLERDISHDDVVDINNVVSGGSLKFHVMRRSPDTVELAMSLQLLNPNGQLNLIRIIQDRLVPVAPCGTTRQPKTQTSPIIITIPPKSTRITAKMPTTKVTQKPDDSKGGKGDNGSKPGKDPNSNPLSNTQTNTASIVIGIGVAAVVAAVVIVLAVVWYRRRSRLGSDQLTLMEHSSAPI